MKVLATNKPRMAGMLQGTASLPGGVIDPDDSYGTFCDRYIQHIYIYIIYIWKRLCLLSGSIVRRNGNQVDVRTHFHATNDLNVADCHMFMSFRLDT